jgi:hypothetical protein
MVGSHSNMLQIKPLVKNAMRKATPKDTGNLAYNAFYVYPTNNGLKTVYRGNIAGYGKILNQSIVLGEGNKNKHFGWHSRAVTNAIAAVVRFYNPKAKGFRMYNNRQVSFKEKSDSFQEGQERMLQQEYKWKMNKAKAYFEKTNPMG